MNAVWSGNLPSTFRQAEFDALILDTDGCHSGATPLVGVGFDHPWWDEALYDPPMRTCCRLRGTTEAKEALFTAMGGSLVTEEFHPG